MYYSMPKVIFLQAAAFSGKQGQRKAIEIFLSFPFV